MAAWAQGISAITLFAEDVDAAGRFYEDVLELPVFFQDDVSRVFQLGGTLVNLLATSAAPELIAPALVAGPEVGKRIQLTVTVPDVEALCRDLTARGVTLLNGPLDRPWGIRTAAFEDPAGHVWEIAQNL